MSTKLPNLFTIILLGIPALLIAYLLMVWFTRELPARQQINADPQAKQCDATGGNAIFDDNGKFLTCYR